MKIYFTLEVIYRNVKLIVKMIRLKSRKKKCLYDFVSSVEHKRRYSDPTDFIVWINGNIFQNTVSCFVFHKQDGEKIKEF